MPSAARKKKKRGTKASVQAVASILCLSLDEVVGLVQRGRIKAKRMRTQLVVDVLTPYDEYEIDYDSAFEYHQQLIEQREKANIHVDQTSSAGLRLRALNRAEMTRR